MMHPIWLKHPSFTPILFSLLFAVWGVSAQDTGLYGAGVDESAILVRLVNGTVAGPQNMKIGAQSLDVRDFGDVSAYKPVAPDIYTIVYERKRYEFIPEIKSYYTIVALPGNLLIFKDLKHEDPARAQIYFYNLSETKEAALRTEDGQINILGPIPPGESAQVAVNPRTIDLAVFEETRKISGVIPIRMVRGSSYSVFLISQTSGIRGFSVLARIETD